MNWTQSYSDTCAELQILRIRESEIKRRVELAYKYTVKGSMPSSGPYVHISLDKGLEKIEQEQHDLNMIRDEIDRIEAIKHEMEKHMQQFTGLANVIQCKRMEGKSYDVIGLELGYSGGYLRKYMSKRGNKEVTQSASAS